VGHLKVIMSDTMGLARVCGPLVALRWLFAIVMNFGEVRRKGNLQPADMAMGAGPYTCKLGKARAKLGAPKVVSGIREIWVRDVYLRGGFLSIKDGDRVVDLGCNKGNFSCLALGHGPDVRCVCVEVHSEQVNRLKSQLELNGFTERAHVVHAFVGRDREQSEKLRELIGDAARGVEIISEDELIERCGIDRIDFLKCDIEGSEFDLLTEDSRLLHMTRQLAIEVHKDVGDAEAFLAMLERKGFEVKRGMENHEAIVVTARRA
jgi:FkbM family methyltransferase